MLNCSWPMGSKIVNMRIEIQGGCSQQHFRKEFKFPGSNFSDHLLFWCRMNMFFSIPRDIWKKIMEYKVLRMTWKFAWILDISQVTGIPKLSQILQKVCSQNEVKHRIQGKRVYAMAIFSLLLWTYGFKHCESAHSGTV